MCTHTHEWGAGLLAMHSHMWPRAPCEAPVCTKPSVPPTPHTEATLGRTKCARSAHTPPGCQLPAGGRPEHVIPNLCQSLRKQFPPQEGRARLGGTGERMGVPPALPAQGWVTLGKLSPCFENWSPTVRSREPGSSLRFWLDTRAWSPPRPFWCPSTAPGPPGWRSNWLGLQAVEAATSGPWLDPINQGPRARPVY